MRGRRGRYFSLDLCFLRLVILEKLEQLVQVGKQLVSKLVSIWSNYNHFLFRRVVGVLVTE